jgi:hypothetical protein
MSTGATSILYSSDGYEIAVSGGSANSANNRAVPIAGSDGANNRLITLDTSGRTISVGAGAAGAAIVGNPLRIAGSDGANTRDVLLDSSGRIISVGAAASGAAVAGNPVLVAGSDGTNARSLRTAADGTLRIDPTGTTTQPISGSVTVTSGSIVVTQSTAANLRSQTSSESNTGAAVPTQASMVGGTDGTNLRAISVDTSGRTVVVGAAADGYAPVGAPVLVAGHNATTGTIQNISTDNLGNQYTVDYGAPANSFRGISFGRVIGTSNTLQAVRATTYTQQSTNAQRSVSSGSASDTSAGTGARQILITYYTATMTGPFTETVTMNGTTPVNTTNTNICFIEKMDVISVGSNGSNIGIISLFVSTGGAGGTIGTIGINNIVNARGDNQTLWAHHYIASGVNLNLTSYMTGTNTNQGATTFLMSIDPTVTTSPEKQITDSVVFSANTSSVVRNFVVPLRLAGPLRITLYVVPAGSNTPFFGGFNFWEL